ncbi:MAG: hypothetical protein JHC98_04995 [Thermoleophilaceae bacterium]|nr:hypothetical protein [Thermoleophilaceae bacterium]
MPETLVLNGVSPFSKQRSVNLLVPSANPAQAFAGVRTAIEFGSLVASGLALPLQVGTTAARGANRNGPLDPSFLAGGDSRVELFRLGDGEPMAASHGDIWIATHWTTAHALDIAARLGRIDRRRVIYLVQDYEPGFMPWSSAFALARATYHAGFTIVCNSLPLATYLETQEGLGVVRDRVFAPHLPESRLRDVASTRVSDSRIGVLFYARPTKPRNLFAIGSTALRIAIDELGNEARTCNFFTAGERHDQIATPSGVNVQQLGQTGWDGYFELLQRVRVGLSLMYSAHPSHPPLEVAVSGGSAVTNRFSNSRDALHPRIEAVEADPDELAQALVRAIRFERERPPGEYAPLDDGALGGSLETAAASAGREADV